MNYNQFHLWNGVIQFYVRLYIKIHKTTYKWTFLLCIKVSTPPDRSNDCLQVRYPALSNPFPPDSEASFPCKRAYIIKFTKIKAINIDEASTLFASNSGIAFFKNLIVPHERTPHDLLELVQDWFGNCIFREKSLLFRSNFPIFTRLFLVGDSGRSLSNIISLLRFKFVSSRVHMS